MKSTKNLVATSFGFIFLLGAAATFLLEDYQKERIAGEVKRIVYGSPK